MLVYGHMGTDVYACAYKGPPCVQSNSYSLISLILRWIDLAVEINLCCRLSMEIGVNANMDMTNMPKRTGNNNAMRTGKNNKTAPTTNTIPKYRGTLDIAESDPVGFL